jgi:GNAT superfamily N-acetyltransferase
MLTHDTPNSRRKKNERSINFMRRSLLSGWVSDPTIETATGPLGLPSTAPRPRRKAQDSSGEGAIECLRAADAPEYLSHLLRLSHGDRRLRFAHQAPDQVIERSVSRIDWDTTALIGWVVDGVVRGVVHLAWPDVDWLEGAAELAVSVETDWQHQGIGSRLVENAIGEARRRDLPGVRYFGLAENTGIVALMQRFGALNTRSGGEIDGRVDLPVDTLRMPGLNRRSRLGRRSRSFRMSGAVERLNLTPQVG